MQSKYKVEKLGKYIEQVRGVSYKPKDVIHENTEGYTVVLRANSIKDNKLVLKDLIYVKDDLIKEKQIIKYNDILMAASSGSKEIVGKSVQILKDTSYSFGAFCKLIRCNNKINSKYVGYFLRTPYYRATISSIVCGANINNLKNEHIDELLIPITSIEDQQKIVDILDKAQELIDKRKAQIEALDELVKSKFIEMFGDILHNDKFDKVILKDVANIGSSKRIYANEYVESGIPFYRSKEIRELGENLKPSIELFISEEKYASVKKQFGVPKKGDILIAAIGATIGYTWIVNTDEAFYYKDGNLLNISINKSMNSIYLNHALKILINDFKYKGAAGTAQLALTIEKVGNMEVVCPPIELQNQFADFVKQVDKLKFEMEKSLKELEDNFNSLMQKAFKGELFN